MNENTLKDALAGLGLGEVRFFQETTSTNDQALRWAQSGAPDLALVCADAQTAGRGRQGRTWLTPPGSALAFSLILRGSPNGQGVDGNPPLSQANLGRLSALGALSVCLALREEYGLPALIKWPNDVLVGGRKLCGVLAEAAWEGDILHAVILGIGVNVGRDSAPPAEKVSFPATSLEQELNRPIQRVPLLRLILARLLHWKDRMRLPAFSQQWETLLAFKGEWVQAYSSSDLAAPRSGMILGLNPDGTLRLLGSDGKIFTMSAGELHLRPLAAHFIGDQNGR